MCAYGDYKSSSDSDWSEEVSYYVGAYKGNMTYSLIDDGNACQIGGKNTLSGKVIIPEELNGVPVTSILNGGFKGLSNVTAYIPDSVTEINNRAFADCENLTRIRLPENVFLLSSTFENCVPHQRQCSDCGMQGERDSGLCSSDRWVCILHVQAT